MAYHCPHCQKFCYAPQGFHKLDGFAMICAHCNKAFDPSKVDADRVTKEHEVTGEVTGDTWPIICPHCDDIMHLQEREYDMLYGHNLVCLTCANSFLLPEKQPVRAGESSASTFLKIGFIYLLILASLGLLFTPKGADIIADLGQISDEPRHYLASFHDIWQDFLAFMQGLFI